MRNEQKKKRERERENKHKTMKDKKKTENYDYKEWRKTASGINVLRCTFVFEELC